MKIEETIIYSDMDGTLLTSWSRGPIISEKNENSIKNYIMQGGMFSIATGRNLKNGPMYLDNYDIKLPMVLVNGALIYDHQNKKVIHKTKLPNAFIEEALLYFSKNSQVALVVSDNDEVYRVKKPVYNKEPALDFDAINVSIDEVKKLVLLKMTFITYENKREQLEKELSYLKTISQVKLSPSSNRFIEIVEKSVNKGEAIKKIISLYNIKNKQLVCIGDYLNDIEMLDIADVAAVPRNGLDILKIKDRLLVNHHDEDSIANLISELIKL